MPIPLLAGIAASLATPLLNKGLDLLGGLFRGATEKGVEKVTEFVKEKTGIDISTSEKVAALTPEQITTLKKLETEERTTLIEWTAKENIAAAQAFAEIQKAFAEADKAGASTRPKIANRIAWVLCFVVVAIISCVVYSVMKPKPIILTRLMDTWPFMSAVLGFPTGLLASYFGMRRKEKTARYQGIAGQPIELPQNPLSRLTLRR